MNKIASFIFIACSLILNAGLARASDLKIGVVDMQKCVLSSEAGKKAKAELEGVLSKKKKEFQDQEAAFKKAQDEFQKKQAALSDSARKEQQAKLQEKLMKLQENAQRFEVEIQKKQQEISEPIIRKVREKVAEIAKKKDLSLVIDNAPQNVIFSEDKIDITEEVFKSLN